MALVFEETNLSIQVGYNKGKDIYNPYIMHVAKGNGTRTYDQMYP